jgi:transposase-like protein
VSQSSKAQPSTRTTRRRFTVEEKLRILAEYEAAATPEARGAVLRSEGIYSSHIALWPRRAVKIAHLGALQNRTLPGGHFKTAHLM